MAKEVEQPSKKQQSVEKTCKLKSIPMKKKGEVKVLTENCQIN